MSRHNISSSSKDSSERRRSSASGGERWAYSVEALRVVHVPVRGVLLWAGSAAVGVMVGAVVWLVRYGLIVPGGILESK